MNRNTISIDDVEYARISKTKASQLFDQGVSILFIGNNESPYSIWYMPIIIRKYENIPAEENTFEKALNNFLYHLPKEYGTYAKFYIRKEL